MPSFDILHSGIEVGFVAWSTAHSREEISGVAGFATHSIDEQLRFLGMAEQYPSAILRSVVIDPDFRRRGYGTFAVHEFEYRMSSIGCGFAVCHVGFGDLEEMNKNLDFYDSLGWKGFYFNDEFILQNRLGEGSDAFCLRYRSLSQLVFYPPQTPAELQFSLTRSHYEKTLHPTVGKAPV
jgi:GNAT superfamily N-acetyltransferase